MGGLITGRPTYLSYHNGARKSIESVRIQCKSVFSTNTKWLIWTVSHLEKQKNWWYYIATKKKHQRTGNQKQKIKKQTISSFFQHAKSNHMRFPKRNAHPLQVRERKQTKSIIRFKLDNRIRLGSFLQVPNQLHFRFLQDIENRKYLDGKQSINK